MTIFWARTLASRLEFSLIHPTSILPKNRIPCRKTSNLTTILNSIVLKTIDSHLLPKIIFDQQDMGFIYWVMSACPIQHFYQSFGIQGVCYQATNRLEFMAGRRLRNNSLLRSIHSVGLSASQCVNIFTELTPDCSILFSNDYTRPVLPYHDLKTLCKLNVSHDQFISWVIHANKCRSIRIAEWRSGCNVWSIKFIYSFAPRSMGHPQPFS